MPGEVGVVCVWGGVVGLFLNPTAAAAAHALPPAGDHWPRERISER